MIRCCIKPFKDQTAVSVCSVIFSTRVPSTLQILHLAWSMHLFVSSGIKLQIQEVIAASVLVFLKEPRRSCCCFNRQSSATSVWAPNLQSRNSTSIFKLYDSRLCVVIKGKEHRVRSGCKLNLFIRCSNVSSHWIDVVFSGWVKEKKSRN